MIIALIFGTIAFVFFRLAWLGLRRDGIPFTRTKKVTGTAAKVISTICLVFGLIFLLPVAATLLAPMLEQKAEEVRIKSELTSIHNQMRMLSAATEQYCLEYSVEVAPFNELVGPNKYIKALPSIAGEDYHTLALRPSEKARAWTLTTGSGQTVTLER